MLCVPHVGRPTCKVNVVVSYKRRNTSASLVGVQKWICVHHVLLYTSIIAAAPVNDEAIAEHALFV